ncbi:tetratricopeptide repeat protein [Terrilactibacillus sp. BCM23-1]|uniref:Tetratricopeptide repeat protein n=2 Tax=Terrilactibacillus tamarindi TaxID=2599694 RepID=A0A6N8CLV9_9BACI|nr:tetratricopeptide repeat protein [Terrilactibacillus tamarindi]
MNTEENMKSEKMSKKARIISFNPNGSYYFQKGVVAYQKGDLYKAYKYVDRAIAFEPNEVEYLCQQASILAELEDYKSSNRILNRIVTELDLGLTECHFFMANNYAYLGEFQDALREVNLYLQEEPHGIFVQDAKELLHLINEESVGYDIDKEPQYISNHKKGRQQLENGQYKKAINLFRKVIKEEPEFWAAYNNLAIAYFSLRLMDKAYATLHHVLERDSGNIHALCNLVTFYHQSNEIELRDTILPRLNKLFPYFPDHRSKLGSTYLFIGDFEKACRWLTSAEKAGVNGDQVFYFWMAYAAYKVGRLTVAKRAWNQVHYFDETPFHPFQYEKVQDMLLDENAYDNFMVHSLIQHELYNPDQAEQLFAIFYLHYLSAQDELNDTAKNHEDPAIRAIASEMVMDLAHKSQNVDHRLNIMWHVQLCLSEGKAVVRHPELYDYWYVVYQMLDKQDEIDVEGWAGALIYLWKKEKNQHTSQAEIAKLCHTSVYRIRKHIQELGQILKRNGLL